ncbi:MAG: biotin-dependent carboxyltransferase family protein [Gemmatimonadales bacterium]
MNILVRRPGLLSTVQDAGRPGWQFLGVGPGGAMDTLALRLANILVANRPPAAALELTLTGPVLQFEADRLIAVTGGALSPTINGAPIPAGRAVLIRGGNELAFGQCTVGCRAYLAIAGGIDVPMVLGSSATNLRAHFGGFEGRPLRAGDRLSVGTPSIDATQLSARLARSSASWVADRAGLSGEIPVRIAPDAPVRLLPGADVDRLSGESRMALFNRPFRVSTQSDRMGYRLDGPRLALEAGVEKTSEGVTWGTVQLPPDGQPIILLADRQTTGGYPVIGHVAAVDLPVVAQRKPGDALRFTAAALGEAQRALIQRERTITMAITALHAQRTSE